MSVRQLKSGRFAARCRIRDEDGITRSVEAQGTTEDEAEAALVEKLNTRKIPTKRRKPQYGPDGERLHASLDTSVTHILPSTPLVDAVKLWLKALDQRGDLKAQTRQFWRETARWTVLRELTDEERKDNPKLDVDSLLVKDFNAGRANQYITELAVKTPVQARSTHQLLTFTLRDAVLWGAIPTNPMLEFKAPKRPRRKPTRALTDAEYRDLLDAITYWRDGHAGEGGVQADKSFALYDLVVVLAGTGLRVNEALGLRLTDIDLASQPPTVTVAGTLVQIGGEPVTYQDGTKSHQGDNRTIAISDDAAAALTRQITLNAHPEYIFTTSTGNLISSRNMSRALRRARPERLDWVTFHTLRRTVATWIEETAGLEAASVQLGHSDPAITKTYYIDEKKGPIIDHSAILNRDERFASG